MEQKLVAGVGQRLCVSSQAGIAWRDGGTRTTPPGTRWQVDIKPGAPDPMSPAQEPKISFLDSHTHLLAMQKRLYHPLGQTLQQGCTLVPTSRISPPIHPSHRQAADVSSPVLLPSAAAPL